MGTIEEEGRVEEDRPDENKNLENREENTEDCIKKQDKIPEERRRATQEHTVRRPSKVSIQAKRWLQTFLTNEANDNSVK